MKRDSGKGCCPDHYGENSRHSRPEVQVRDDSGMRTRGHRDRRRVPTTRMAQSLITIADCPSGRASRFCAAACPRLRNNVAWFAMRVFRFLLAFAIAVISLAFTVRAADPPQTKIVMLGTGTPRAAPDRFGPATAIVIGDRAYLVDVGAGVVRRAAAAAAQGISALEPPKLS